MEDINNDLDIDPIYGNRIENCFTLGKTNYSLFSLYDWFIIRKCFINPMTNNYLNSIEQAEIIEKFKEFNLLPPINFSKMNSNRIVQIMEKHKLILDEIKKQEAKIDVLNQRLQINEEKLKKARKKEKHEEMIQKIKEKIIIQEKILQNLKVI